MIEGVVKWFNEEKGYGFIRSKALNNDVFVHMSAVRESGYDTLYEKDIVEFEVQTDQRGRERAFNIVAYEPIA
jgi:CspA family cold shock protein